MCTRDHRRHRWGPWRWVDAKKGPCQRRRCGRCGLRETRPNPFQINWARLEREVQRTLKDPEMSRLAQKAVASQEAWNARRAKMTPEELKADTEAWAKRLAEEAAQFTD